MTDRATLVRSLARRLLYGACGLSVATFVVVVLVSRAMSPSGPVGLHMVDQGFADNALVDHAVYFGVPVSADGSGTVDIVSARVTGVPDGMTILAVGGQQPDMSLGRPRYVGMEGESALRTAFPLFRLHAITDVHVKPGRDAGWDLVIVAKATRPGNFVTGGLDVTAQRSGRTETIHVRFTIEIDAVDPHRHVDLSQPVHLLADCPGSEKPLPQTWAAVVSRAVQAGGGEAVVKLASGSPQHVWNTPDGARPTQAMVDGGLVPAIYEEDRLVITQVIAGHLTPGPATALLLGGESGGDTQGGCSLAINHSTNGGEYLAVFGPPLPFDRPAQQPVIELRDLAVIADGVAATAYGQQSIDTH